MRINTEHPRDLSVNWPRLLRSGVRYGRWPELWRQARIAPLVWSARMCRALHVSQWQPVIRQEAFAQLTALAVALPNPDAVMPPDYLDDAGRGNHAGRGCVAASVDCANLNAEERAWVEFARALDAVRLPLTVLKTTLITLAEKFALPHGENLLPHLNDDAIFMALCAEDWEILAEQAERLSATLTPPQREATVAVLEALVERSDRPVNEITAECIRLLARSILRSWATQKPGYGDAARAALGRLFLTHGETLTGPVDKDLFSAPKGDQDKVLYYFLTQQWGLLEIQDDPALITLALKQVLAQGGEQVDRVMRGARQADRAVASVAVARAAGDVPCCLPQNPAQRALHYFLLAQWEAYEALDVDDSLLSAAYLAASGNLKHTIAAHARQHGRIEWVRAVAQLPEQQRGLEGANFWGILAETLAQGQHWRQLWKLVQKLPLRAGILLLQRLHGSGWNPAESELPDFAALLETAAQCPTELPVTQPLKYYASRDSAFSISADGQWLASTMMGAGIKLRHLATGEERRIYNFENRAEVNAIAFSPDGQYVASASKERFCLWRVNNSERLLNQPLDAEVRLAFTPDGLYVISWPPHDSSGPVLLWRVPDGACMEIAPRDLRIADVCVSPRGDWIATAQSSGEGAIRRWRLPDGKPLAILGAADDEDSITALCFSPDGSVLLSGHKSNAIRVWQARTGALLTTLHEHKHPPALIAFSPDGKVFASADTYTLHLWRTLTFEKYVTPLSLDPRCDYKGPTVLTFSPNGRIVALARRDQRYVNLYHVTRGTHLGVFDGGQRRYTFNGAAFTPDGAHLVCATHEPSLQLWPLTGALLLAARPNELNAADSAWLENCAARSPDPWAQAILAILRWQRRHDIELADYRPLFGDEFDIELE